ncbi:MAG TPA: DUF484 family protein [Acetobacteraceae bacterium]|nr:DUF484 family protein [Acetobacteraceae bacterium]
MPSDSQPDEADAAFVAAFLRAHPAWLAVNPDLYRILAPPARVHGDRLADHMAAMVQVERAHAAAMAERADDVLAAGRAAAGLTGRVQEAVLALLRSNDPMDCITSEMPGILAMDAIHMCVEALHPVARPLPQGTVGRLLNGRQVLFREIATDARLLHAEAAGLAGHDALVRIPGEGPPALLALLARDAGTLDPIQGAGALGFLGRAVAAALGR